MEEIGFSFRLGATTQEIAGDGPAENVLLEGGERMATYKAKTKKELGKVPPVIMTKGETLDSIGVESAFPKPFCTLEPGEGDLIDEFIDTYKIGRPICYADVKDNVIAEIGPLRSAPCGCTWYVSQKVRGKSLDDLDALFDEVAKAHHSYPCTASMAKDREVGDALLHVAGYNARYAVCDAVGIEDCRNSVEKSK